MRALSALPTSVVESEAQLVAAVRAGDDRAFERLYSHYRDRIFAFILRRVQDHGRAEDVAQEVFISAVRRLRSDDRPVAFKPWIYEIAKNACVDEHRRRSRSREVPLPDGPDPGGPLLASLAATPPAAVAGKQQLDDLRGAFGGLSPSHHQLLVMRELEGLGYDEIGERLGMTRQMVESGLFRARRKLTVEYEELASGRRCEQVQTAIESGSLRSVANVGVRERRRIARHLAHCQPCRHVALMAGVDSTLLRPRSIAAKIAALLPAPLARWLARRGSSAAPGGGSGGGGWASGSGTTGVRSGHGAVGGGSLHAAAAATPPASSIALGPAVAAVAAIAIAGGGITGALLGSSAHRRPAPAVSGPVAGPAAQSNRPMTRRAATGATTSNAAGRHSRDSMLRTRRSGPGAPGASGAGLRAAGPGGAGTGSGVGGPALAGASGGGPTGSVAARADGAVRQAAQAAGGAVGAAGTSVAGATSEAGRALGAATGAIGSATGGAVGQAGTAAQGAGGAVQQASGVVSGAGAAVSQAGSTVSATGGAVSGAVGAVSSAGGSAAGSAGAAAGAVGAPVGGATGTAGSALGGGTAPH